MDLSREGGTVCGGDGAGLLEGGPGDGLDGTLLGGPGAGRLNKPMRNRHIMDLSDKRTYRALYTTWRVCFVARWCSDGAHFVPDVSATFLIEFDDLHHSLRVFLLFRSGDAALLK